MRLAKIADHTVAIVDVPDGGGDGIEYHPHNPDRAWAAHVEVRRGGATVIRVGDYVLTATPRSRNFL